VKGPVTPEKLATLGAALRLERGTRVLDLGSGSGEMLCTWTRDDELEIALAVCVLGRTPRTPYGARLGLKSSVVHHAATKEKKHEQRRRPHFQATGTVAYILERR
jgi:hypothetical protein